MQTTLKKNGKLFITQCHSDIECPKDVTDAAPSFLYEAVVLEEGVLLHDLFKLLEPDLELYDMLFRNWLAEYVKEGLKVDRDETYKDPQNQIKGIAIQNQVEISEYSTKKEFTYSFNVYGVGVDPDTPRWGLSLTDVKELVNLPLFLIPDVAIYTTKWSNDKRPREIISMENEIYKRADFYSPYLLSEVIHHIFWELSFHGGIEGKKEMAESLSISAEELRRGEVETFSLDDILSKKE